MPRARMSGISYGKECCYNMAKQPATVKSRTADAGLSSATAAVAQEEGKSRIKASEMDQLSSNDSQTELDRTKEKLENCIIRKEKEYAILWNNWYTKCEECKYDKISYDKLYNDIQQKIEWLQAQLEDLKGKSSDTQYVSNTLDLVSQKLKDENVSLEFQVRSYAKENEHLKTTYKNLFDSIKVT
ncbi:hypothetical protein Tco_1401825 [Tanacetum coccineum]